MPSFALKGQIPILEMKAFQGPFVFLKVGDRQLEIRQVKRVQGKFWESSDGVFELDGEYEYKLWGSAVYFYNLYNSKPISISGIEQVQKIYRERKMSRLVTALQEIYDAVKGEKKGIYSPIHALKKLSEVETGLPLEDQKFLVDYISYNKDDLKLQNIKEMTQKKLNMNLSMKIITIFPMLIFAGIGITAVVIMRFANPLKLIGI